MSRDRDLELSAVTAAPVPDTAMNSTMSRLVIDAFLAGEDDDHLAGLLRVSRGPVERVEPTSDTLGDQLEDLARDFVGDVLEAIESTLSTKKTKRKAKPSKRSPKTRSKKVKP